MCLYSCFFLFLCEIIYCSVNCFNVILFVVYLSKCWVSRTDCSTCHSDVKGEPGLRCGWCKAGTPRCVVKEGCSEANDWIPFTSPCLTTPNITKVFLKKVVGYDNFLITFTKTNRASSAEKALKIMNMSIEINLCSKRAQLTYTI